MTTHDHPFIVGNEALREADALADLMEEHGYVYLRCVLDPEPILRARRDILELCREAGWLDPGADLMDGVYSGTGASIEGDPEYMAVYRRVLDLPSFLALPHDPALMEVTGRLLGGDVLVHPRKIGRITFPGNEADATPAHQDYVHVRGAVRTYSAWWPLGDCPRSLGGLAILDGSHRSGLHEHVETRGTGSRGIVVGDEEASWHSGDMAVGDCLLFHSHTVHKALPNNSGRYLRISTDNRYQLAGDEIDPGSLRPHFAMA